jgi:LmbE family N-acetylglucosaminyl deacetylase
VRRILCLGAHSDDIEIGVGGTLLSLASKHPDVEIWWAVFSALGYALKKLAKADSLREEVNTKGVRVMSVFTGRTATPRIQALSADEGRRYDPERLLQPADIASVVLNAVSLPWTAEVTNITIRPMVKS